MSMESDEDKTSMIKTADDMRILEVSSLARTVEKPEWAAVHAGLDKLPFKGKGQRVGVLDTGCDINHQDLKGQVEGRNFIRGNREKPNWRDISGHGCIHPEARIFTSFCGLEAIETFFDRVEAQHSWVEPDGAEVKDIAHLEIDTIGFDGTKCCKARVTHAHRLKHTGKIFRVRSKSNACELLLTPWHPVYVSTSSRGKKHTIKRIRADELKPGYKLIMNDSLQAPGHTQTVALADYITSGIIECSSDIEITPDLGWLVGLILTDGHIAEHNNGYWITITQSRTRLNLLEDAKAILGDYYINSTIREMSHQPGTYELKAFGKGLVRMLQTIGIPVGAKSKSVVVPPLIAKSPINVILAFIGGCIDGDGCVTDDQYKHGHIRIATASHKFASDLSTLLKSSGIMASCVFNKGSVTSTFGACDMWHVGFTDPYKVLGQYVHCTDKRDKLYTGPHKHRKYVTIGSVEEENFDGVLYDLTVENCHNYLAEGVIVSNTFCTGEIVAKAPEATALSGRVLYGNRKDHTRRDIDGDIAQAVLACIADGCHVISMSLGGPGQTRKLTAAIDKAVDAGLLVFAAAGNERTEGSPYISYPAGHHNVISVAAANSDDFPAWFSTVGKGRNKLQQPEVAVASLEYYWGCIPGKSNYGRMIGTSMSTPLMAGAALLWREAMEKSGKLPTGSDVLKVFRKWLYKVLNDTNRNGWDAELGYGVLLLEDGELE